MGEISEYYAEQELLDDEFDDFDEEELSNELAEYDPLVWTTVDGVRIPLSQMGTIHLFNSMKMCFNHLAAHHGGQPVMFTKEWNGAHALAVYNPAHLAGWVVAMLAELDRRTDIPFSLIRPLEEIRSQLMPKRLED